jgi:hypothetical protein
MRHVWLSFLRLGAGFFRAIYGAVLPCAATFEFYLAFAEGPTAWALRLAMVIGYFCTGWLITRLLWSLGSNPTWLFFEPRQPTEGSQP